MPSEMANNDRKQIPRFIAPRCGAISYVFIFLSLSVPRARNKNNDQKFTSNHRYKFTI